jgi:hypothetical protein
LSGGTEAEPMKTSDWVGTLLSGRSSRLSSTLVTRGLATGSGLAISPLDADRATRQTEFVCVQNLFTLADQRSLGVLQKCRSQNIAFVPFVLWRGPRCAKGHRDESVAHRRGTTPGGDSRADRRCVVARPCVLRSLDSGYSNPCASHGEHWIRDVPTGRGNPKQTDDAVPEPCRARNQTVKAVASDD